MLNENSSIPLYVQLYQVFLDNINSGKWYDGFKIPSELEICEQFGVSRMTVRLALDKLKSLGYLYRKSGRGTYITMPSINQPLSTFYSFSDSTDGVIRKSKLIAFDCLPCEEDIASMLKIEPYSPVFITERVRSVGDTPFAYELSYIPQSFCPQLNAASISMYGLYKTLKMLAGSAPDHAHESFCAVKIQNPAAQYLNCRASEPALSIQRIAYLGDSIVEYCDSLVRGDRIKYHVELRQL